MIGVCVMITSVLLRTKTERWREECPRLKILETYEYLRWWWWRRRRRRRTGLVTGAVTECPMSPRAQVEAQLIIALLGDAALVEDGVE
jgi:hypothetical protein